MEMSSVPRLAAGCRLHATDDLVLIPEGTLDLSGPAREIMARIDGKRTVNAIVDDLLLQFEGATANEVQQDVLGMLNRMQQRGVIQA